MFKMLAVLLLKMCKPINKVVSHPFFLSNPTRLLVAYCKHLILDNPRRKNITD